MSLAGLETPALILDVQKLDANIARLSTVLEKANLPLRPHVKTCKSIDVLHRVADDFSQAAIAVSTLKEADVFAEQGISDIIYAVGFAPNKTAHAARLIRQGVDLIIITDSVAGVQAIDKAFTNAKCKVKALIEIDTDGHRAGLAPDGAALLEVAEAMHNATSIELAGVLTHAGGSYESTSTEELSRYATRERDGAVLAAGRLRERGYSVPVVSIGSTPTALFNTGLAGVTEVRAGVFMFQDLVMAGIGVCRPEDIAVSVLTTVIGQQLEKNWVLIDAGWMALSRDRGTSRQTVDQGYGVVCDEQGNILEDFIVIQANQEHGVIARRSGAAINSDDFPVGRLLRILPNHACATAAQHDSYHLVSWSGDDRCWPRFCGW